MRRFVTLIIVMLLCASAVFIPTFAQSSSSVKEEYLNEDKWLTLSSNTTGARYFVDKQGNPVNLFGMARCQGHASSENILYSPIGSVDTLVEHYADYGCNFMRLAIECGDLCGGEKRTADEINAYISEHIDPDVQAIIRNGLYVMLDMHMYPPELGTAEATVQYARDYYLPVLIELAKKYKDEPMVAVIELWNEPYAADHDNLTFNKDEWNVLLRDYFIDAVNEIRKYDTRHVLLVSDWNAGWGCAIPETWNGYYNKVDPVYHNTCFSVHASITELDTAFDFYQNWWKNLANSNNLCLLFGEVETEGGISSEAGIQNFCDMFSENEDKYHFSGVLWRPHGPTAEYHSVWADSGWAAEYCKKYQPNPTSRYAIEAENLLEDSNTATLSKDSRLFGSYKYGTGISLKPNLEATDFYESSTTSNLVYSAGNYKLVVRAFGDSKNSGDFIVGYRDISGVIHQIARFSGKNSNMEPYYQTVDFNASKQIASMVFFSCETGKASSIIDRVYIVGEASTNETVKRNRVTILPISQVIDLNGKKYTIESDTDNSSKDSTGTFNNGNSGISKDNYAIQDSSEATVEVTAPKKSVTTLLKNRIINKNATNLIVMTIVMCSLLLIAGVFILVNFIVSKKKSKPKL